MNIEVSILKSSGDKLELLIQGEVTIRQIDFAFQDGLRNHAHAEGVLVDSANSIRQLEGDSFVLACYPFYSGRNRDRVNSGICYSLMWELRHPIKTSH